MSTYLVYQNEMDDLAKNLDFGANCLNKQKNDPKKMRIRKRILFGMIVAAHNYTESIYCLCKEGRSHACHVLLRSLTENLINAKYLFATSNSEHAKTFFLNSLLEKKKQLQKAIDLSKKDLSLNFNPQFLKELQESLTKTVVQIERIHRKSAVPPLPCLYDRALAVDKYNKIKGLKSASHAWEYTLIYCTLCNTSHLDHRGLSEFFEYDSEGFVNAFLSGNPNDIEVILQYTQRLYEDMIKMFLNKFTHSSSR